MSYKETKPGSVSYLSVLYIVLLFIRAPFHVLLVFVAMCSALWLFWLRCQYLPSDFAAVISSWTLEIKLMLNVGN